MAKAFIRFGEDSMARGMKTRKSKIIDVLRLKMLPKLFLYAIGQAVYSREGLSVVLFHFRSIF